MSTILNTNGTPIEVPQLGPYAKGKFFVITAELNSKITHALRDGALRVLAKAGLPPERIISLSVPGTVELINAAGGIVNRMNEFPSCGDENGAEAVIILGCVIRGDTPHFDYVCEIASQGTAILNAEGKAPVIFGVLTVDNEEQALQRAGGSLGNKGEEAAYAAITMVQIHETLNQILIE